MIQILKHPMTDRSLTVDAGVVRLVGYQEGQVHLFPTLWIERDPEAVIRRTVTYTFYGTGDPIPDHLNFVGSAICGPYVWHVYTDAPV